MTSTFATCNARIIVLYDYFTRIWLRLVVTNFLHSALIPCLLFLYPLMWTFYTNIIKLLVSSVHERSRTVQKWKKNCLFYIFVITELL